LAFPVAKPGTEMYRLVEDFTGLNNATITESAAMPHLEHSLAEMVDAKVFGKYDMKKGYYQLAVEPASRPLMGILFPDGVYHPRRVIPGRKNATAAFQRAVESILQGAERHITWLDDTMLHSTGLKQHLDTIRKDLENFKNHHAILNLAKCIFAADEVEFLGKIFTNAGVSESKARIQALLDIPRPETADKLIEVMHALNYSRGSIPNFARITRPLFAYLDTLHRRVGSRRKAKVRKHKIEWDKGLSECYAELIQEFSNQLLLSYPKAGFHQCIFTDASEHGFGSALTQIPRLPVLGESIVDLPHEFLGFSSGHFGPEHKSWDVAEKEFYGLLHGINKFRTFVSGTLIVVTDHANFAQLLSSKILPNVNSIRHKRVIRWRSTLAESPHVIYVIAGKDNVWADMLSRRKSAIALPLLIDSPHSDDFTWPTMEEIKGAQELSQDSEKAKFTAKNGLLQDAEGKTWIPDNGAIRTRLFIAAHCGSSGHRGVPATMAALSDHFVGKGLQEQLEKFIAQCIHCLSSKNYGKVARPMGKPLWQSSRVRLSL
jgi:hypothetical protein